MTARPQSESSSDRQQQDHEDLHGQQERRRLLAQGGAPPGGARRGVPQVLPDRRHGHTVGAAGRQCRYAERPAAARPHLCRRPPRQRCREAARPRHRRLAPSPPWRSPRPVDTPRSCDASSPWVEVALGAWLLLATGAALVVVATLTLVLFVAYLVLVVRAVRRPEPVDCGCFGALGDSRVTRVTVWRNAALVLSALLAVLAGPPRARRLIVAAGRRGRPSPWLAMTALAVAVAVLVTYRSPATDARRRRPRRVPRSTRRRLRAADHPVMAACSTSRATLFPLHAGDDACRAPAGLPLPRLRPVRAHRAAGAGLGRGPRTVPRQGGRHRPADDAPGRPRRAARPRVLRPYGIAPRSLRRRHARRRAARHRRACSPAVPAHGEEDVCSTSSPRSPTTLPRGGRRRRRRRWRSATPGELPGVLAAVLVAPVRRPRGRSPARRPRRRRRSR